MKRMKINILGMSEVRCQGARKITSRAFKIFYSGGAEHERGVAIMLDQGMGKTVKGYGSLSDCVLLLKVAEKPLDLNIIQIYAPTSTKSDQKHVLGPVSSNFK